MPENRVSGVPSTTGMEVASRSGENSAQAKTVEIGITKRRARRFMP
jgi:hypothetical protein